VAVIHKQAERVPAVLGEHLGGGGHGGALRGGIQGGGGGPGDELPLERRGWAFHGGGRLAGNQDGESAVAGDLYLCTYWWGGVGWQDYSFDIEHRIQPMA
jgi:hypothetical protein